MDTDAEVVKQVLAGIAAAKFLDWLTGAPWIAGLPRTILASPFDLVVDWSVDVVSGKVEVETGVPRTPRVARFAPAALPLVALELLASVRSSYPPVPLHLRPIYSRPPRRRHSNHTYYHTKTADRLSVHGLSVNRKADSLSYHSWPTTTLPGNSTGHSTGDVTTAHLTIHCCMHHERTLPNGLIATA